MHSASISAEAIHDPYRHDRVAEVERALCAASTANLRVVYLNLLRHYQRMTALHCKKTF